MAFGDVGLLVERGPGQFTEFLPSPDPTALAEVLVAFANADGGTVILGMGPDGRVEEAVVIEELEGALREAQTQCHPPVPLEWEQVEMERGVVAVIRVPRSLHLHSLSDGRVFIRRGKENRLLSGEEVRRLASSKGIGDYEEEVAPGARRSDLDDEIIQEYIAKREERLRRQLNLSTDELLLEIGAIKEDGRPTIAGLLLFGSCPQSFLPQSGLVFVRFVGTERRGEAGLPGYGRREEIEGPLPRLIEKAWEVIWEEMRIGAVVRGLVREERTEYPPFAVREALVNAVAHRDYRIRGRRIEVFMFDDRLEVTSPGGLPGYITLDNIVEEHFSRNPRIVSGLFYWGFIEELGLGIDRMIEEMVNAGRPPPQFKATPYSFTVTLYNVQERPPIPQWQRSMNERQLMALNYIREKGRITSREYRALCPNVSAETLRLDLVDLVKKGVLLKIGDKKGTYYILK